MTQAISTEIGNHTHVGCTVDLDYVKKDKWYPIKAANGIWFTFYGEFGKFHTGLTRNCAYLKEFPDAKWIFTTLKPTEAVEEVTQ